MGRGGQTEGGMKRESEKEREIVKGNRRGRERKGRGTKEK